LEGDWTVARDSFDYSLSMDDRDQPAKVLLDYMSGFNYQVRMACLGSRAEHRPWLHSGRIARFQQHYLQAPKTWAGYRPLTSK
jgi:hypothetical protein